MAGAGPGVGVRGASAVTGVLAGMGVGVALGTDVGLLKSGAGVAVAGFAGAALGVGCAAPGVVVGGDWTGAGELAGSVARGSTLPGAAGGGLDASGPAPPEGVPILPGVAGAVIGGAPAVAAPPPLATTPAIIPARASTRSPYAVATVVVRVATAVPIRSASAATALGAVAAGAIGVVANGGVPLVPGPTGGPTGGTSGG